MRHCAGLSFYNFSVTLGIPEDYERIVDFFIENTQVNHIILQLHGEELYFLDYYVNRWNTLKNLYVFDSKPSSKLIELKNILLSSINSQTITYFQKIILKKEINDSKINQFGTLNTLNPTEETYITLVNDYILPKFKSDYKNIFTEKLLYGNSDTEQIYEILARIKRKCVINGINLTLIHAPTSPTVLAHIESPAYWEYLRNIAAIHEFYNFNGYTHFNFNPYNFLDDNHYRKEVADKMLRIIFEQEEPEDPDWGLLLSSDTIDAYIERRKESYYQLKQAYEETGNIPLGSLYDSSFIPLMPSSF